MANGWRMNSGSLLPGHRREDQGRRDILSPEETPSGGLGRKALCNANMWAIIVKKKPCPGWSSTAGAMFLHVELVCVLRITRTSLFRSPWRFLVSYFHCNAPLRPSFSPSEPWLIQNSQRCLVKKRGPRLSPFICSPINTGIPLWWSFILESCTLLLNLKKTRANNSVSFADGSSSRRRWRRAASVGASPTWPRCLCTAWWSWKCASRRAPSCWT